MSERRPLGPEPGGRYLTCTSWTFYTGVSSDYKHLCCSHADVQWLLMCSYEDIYMNSIYKLCGFWLFSDFYFNYALGCQKEGHGRGDFHRVIFISRTFCSQFLLPPELQVWPECLEEMECIIIISCKVQWYKRERCLQTRWENLDMRDSFASNDKEVPFDLCPMIIT